MSARTATHFEDVVRSPIARKALVGLRLVLGFYFLWAFLDKLFGLGYSTPSERSWLNGSSPTAGFLTMNPAVKDGPFGSFFSGIATGPLSGIADVLFMLGLLGIGVALLAGAGLKLAAWTGTLLLAMMYLAELPLGRAGEGFTNPIFDAHWIEALALWAIAYTFAGDSLGLGRWWSKIAGDGWLR